MTNIIQSRYAVVSNARFHHQDHSDFVKHLINVYLLEKVYIIKNLRKFAGKHLCWSLFLIKLQAFTSATLLKSNSNTDVFL